jgi:hypothetical protein
MIDMKQRVVADRIARLSEEAAAVRIGRALDRVGASGTPWNTGAATIRPQPFNSRSPLRARVGSWLVSVGHSIAGPSSPARSGRSRGS